MESPEPSWQGTWQEVSRHDIGAVAETLHVIYKHEAEREISGTGF